MLKICTGEGSLLCLAALLVASNAEADIIWLAGMLEDAPIGVHTFRIETSPTAYIEHTTGPGNGKHWTAADGANVAELFSDLTNGVNNPVTVSTSLFSHTVDEDFFFSSPSVSVPFSALGSIIDLGDSPDLPGTYDSIRIECISKPGGQMLYHLSGFGALPEPASATLLVLGLCCCHGLRTVGRRRSTGR